MLDDRGAKLIKQRNKNIGEQEEHNIFRGMNDLDNFNREYNDYRQKVGFERNYQMLNDIRNNRLNVGNNYVNNRDNQPLGLHSGEDFNNNINDFRNDLFIIMKIEKGELQI